MAKNFWQSSHYLQWMFDRQDILLARSADLKIFSEDEYQKLMIFFANVIQALGEQSKVKQQVIATATVYFKRFYARYSLKCIDPFLMIPTCVFLASKVEESGIMSSQKLMPNYQQVMKNKFPYAGVSDIASQYRIQNVWEAEFFLLELLSVITALRGEAYDLILQDCCLILYLPYRPLRQLIAPEFEKSQPENELMYTTWKVINDSLRTDVCLLFPPYQIALGCLFVAATVSKRMKTDNVAWFADLCVDMDKVMEVVRHLMHLYELWKGFDEKREIAALLQRMPKPHTSPSRPPSAQSQPLQQQMRQPQPPPQQESIKMEYGWMDQQMQQEQRHQPMYRGGQYG